VPAKIFLPSIKKQPMEVTNTERQISPQTTEDQFDKNFKPKGAIAFFVVLVIIGLIIWYGIYFLMLERI
jgi:hypothetical protein